ncbi:MAG: diguanylate cyclase [Ruminococcaceae bacterium]|nr:diguanylate cyclase [Oscillospiraceae bacterium]
MTVTDVLQRTLEWFMIDGVIGKWLWPVLILVVCVLCLYFAVQTITRAIDGKKFTARSIVYFVILLGAVILWALPLFLIDYQQAPTHTALLSYLEHIGQVFIPCLLVLHIQKQVSYKEVTPLVLIAWLVVPAALCVWMTANFTQMGGWAAPLVLSPYWDLIYYVFTFICLIRCYLMCFNVFYQMPRHMRKPAYRIIAAITLVLAGTIFSALPTGLQAYNFPVLLVGVAVDLLYGALSTSSSANLIATSRDFVFGTQATMVLVLSNSLQILDWNKKDKNAHKALPYPQYKESFDHYKKRMLEEGHGQVSPHGDNIMLLTAGGTESQFLITISEIRNNKWRFGYLVEISEVSIVYGVLRLFEDIATVDQMTGLLNRNAYLRTVQKYVDQAVLPLCVVVGDVNNLKRMNDTLGHLVGDRLLRAVAGFIRQSTPEGIKVFRIGGDEFVLLLPRGTAEDARRFIERVDALCAADHDPQYGTPSVSWGYAVRTDAAQEYNDVFAAADKMMYALKKERFQFTSSGMVPTEPAQPAPSVQPPPPRPPVAD